MEWVMAGLDPAIPLNEARLCHSNRDRRVKPGDDGVGVHLIPKAALLTSPATANRSECPAAVAAVARPFW
jgi:hypothetical protein